MNLSSESETIVQETATLVAEHADQASAVFYHDMFNAHPELLNVFNEANQAIGEQPKALGASVVAFAVHLIDPNAPDFTPVMQRIAHKHVSLGIRASDYLIVGRYLLGAIAKVVGDAMTPPIAAAWDEVYWLFATALIAEEARLYAQAGTDPDQPYHKYRIVERFEESDEAFSLLLAPVSGMIPNHRTGQYVSIAVDLPDGLRQPRQYTISSGPSGDTLRVTIKRVFGVDGAPDGRVSSWLYHNATPGSLLDVSQPAGDVVLDESDAPLVLVSAGIGITPVAAIIEDLSRRQPDRMVRIFHADKSHAHHPLYAAMRRQILAMSDAQAQTWYEKDAESAPTLYPARSGFMDLSDIQPPQQAVVFMCGPLPFMQIARKTLIDQGVPSASIHYEVFGPDLWAHDPA